MKNMSSGVFITALSVALGACGGGGGSSTETTTTATAPGTATPAGTTPTTPTTTPTTPTTPVTPTPTTPTPTPGTSSHAFKAQVWADNWFSLSVGDTYVGEDSVSITTERSFNSETLSFNASYPFDLNFIIKDYKQNDSGLEYIGLPTQQMGDGGFITQITDTGTGKVIAASGSDFKCKVIHKAPLNPGCASEANPTPASCGFTSVAEPALWKTNGFDTSGWESATLYTAAQIGVKDGYNDIAWDASARLIWTANLKTDNTLLCKLTVTDPGTGVAAPVVTTVTPTTPVTSTAFALTSLAATEGGTLPDEYTCDGAGSTPALAWSNPPAGTKSYAVMMTTIPTPGSVKWSWVLYNIPASSTGLAKNTSGVGTLGVGSNGASVAYQPPCSQGSGAKTYTLSVHALSAAPVLSVPASQVTGEILTSAIAQVSLGSATLNLSHARAATGTTTTTPTTTPTTTLAAACTHISNSLQASTTGTASATCDSTYAYIASNGLATHSMMNGIVATNLQVPVAQNFFGSNAWKIPLTPAIAASTTTAVDGPVGVAINGVPIFNPCKQGGCQNGDTKVLGELDVCNGHAGRADDYHYHAAPTCLMAGQAASYWDTHPLGWALDGFGIFGYNNADGTVATRDAVCGGNTLAVPNAAAGYSYHVTDASPYVLSCFRGTPSPDLAGQGAKFTPLRQPPVTPFGVSGMTLTTDATDGYQVLQFSSARSFTTTETGTDSFVNAAGSYKIRYKPVTGAALATLLAASPGKSACWSFQFGHASSTTSQNYCR